MPTTQDINTAAAPAHPAIANLKDLTDVVYEMATTALILQGAESTLQSRIEALKRAFDESSADLVTLQAARLAAVEAYCEAHKDELFPVKGGKRKKSFPILQHQLQYRSSDAVEAPANAVAVIQAAIFNSEVAIQNLGPCDESTRIVEVIGNLERLIRQPAPELDKDAVKALRDEEVINFLAEQGISVKTSETFKVAFKFTPTSAA